MDKEIEIGEYVRTEKGTITKYNAHDILFNKFENKYYYTYDTFEEDSVSELVVKSSPNIIDLIEVGDYVNGKEIIYIDDGEFFEKSVVYGYKYKDECRVWSIYQEDIKTIVTKEQFERMEYKIHQ